ncbi:MAG: NAD(P)-dependent oxidoreductase [Sphingomicrobium sp.]
MNRILVTGATGFLGSHVVRALVGRGTAVVATGRDGSKAPPATEGLTFVAADLSNASDVERLREEAGLIDAVVHAAALSAPWGSCAAFHSANVIATEHMLELARSSGARRFVHISTPSVYFRFEDQLDVRESDPLPKPVNLYAATKRKAEELVLNADALDGFILRPRGLYGAGDTALLPRLIRAARQRPLPLLRNGQAMTDLTHVTDAAQAILAALDAPPGARGIYNISGGIPLRLKDVIDRACERSGITARWRSMSMTTTLAAARAMEWACACLPSRPEPPITAYGVGVLAFSQTLNIDAARHSLGWTPNIGFDEGLDLTFGKDPHGA